MTIYLTEKEVGALVDINDAVAAVEAVGRSMAADETIFVPRMRLRMRSGFLQLMPASMEKDGIFGYKAYTSFKGKTRFFVHLFDGESGTPLAIIEADRLGQLRTGAASAVATKILSRKNSTSLGVIGSGYQAETQLLAVLSARDFAEVKVYSRNFDHARLFCEKMQNDCVAKLRPVKDIAEAAGCDVVCTITSSMTPVLAGDSLSPGCHLNAAGGNMLVKRELDERTVERAGLIVIDSREQGEKECGDFLPLLEKGRLHWSEILEFPDLFNGVAARTDESQITLFKSQGIAPWDVALGKIVYDRALERKVGTKLPL